MVVSCTVQKAPHPTTYRAIRRGCHPKPCLFGTVGLLRPGDARVGRRIDEAVIYRGDKFLRGMGWVVEDVASDSATHRDSRYYIHLRRDQHTGWLCRAPCIKPRIQSRTVPSDEDAIENHSSSVLLVCGVQVTPESVDVWMEAPFAQAASFCGGWTGSRGWRVRLATNKDSRTTSIYYATSIQDGGVVHCA